MAFLRNTDFFLEVSKGNIPKHSSYNVVGINNDIDTASTPEDVLNTGGTFVPPTTYRIHNIKSTNAGDGVGGTGWKTLLVKGVVSTGLASETIVLNGTSNVATTNSYSDIYALIPITVGVNNTNLGDITATAQTDATVTASVLIGESNSVKKCIRLIPPGYTGYIHRWQATMSQAQQANYCYVQLLYSSDGKVWQVLDIQSLNNSGSSSEANMVTTPFKLQENYWVKVATTQVSGNNTGVKATIDIILVEN